MARPKPPTWRARRQAMSQATTAEAMEQFALAQRASAALLERFTPWLTEFGNWIFGGLIAFMLVILAAFITIGPVDTAIVVATLAFALALPLDLAGLVLLRVVADLKDVRLEDEMAQALRDAGFPGAAAMPASTTADARRRRRTRNALYFALGILALSMVLTLAGVVAALWHVAWWIAVAFLVMALISGGVVIVALFLLQPPTSPEERERQQRYWADMLRQARESSAQSDQTHEQRSGV